MIEDTQKRESGRKVQLSNIVAARSVCDIVATCLGPKAMLKMLMDPMGGIVITNDGNAILREITVQHPASKSIIEIARTQEEEVGDGTTSVVILAGELMAAAEPFIEQNLHPLHIIKGFKLALDDAVNFLKSKLAITINPKNKNEVLSVIKSCLGTKISSQWSELTCSLAWEAVSMVTIDSAGKKEADIKRYIRVEKIAGACIEDSCILRGIVLNKDVLHPSMPRCIKNPRILLLDCGLEYKKGESMTNIEVLKEEDFDRLLKLEEEAIKKMCIDIIKHKPNLVITEKGCSDLAMYFLSKAGIAVLRRTKKTDNNRIARATGAIIVNRTEDIKEDDIGKGCGLFEVKKIGDEYYSYLVDCKNPKACSIILRGANKDILNEIDRNLHDAMSVARNIILDPSVVPGGGATEIAIATYLENKSKSIDNLHQYPYKAAAKALEIIPKILIKNCGHNPIRVLTELRSKHSSNETNSHFYGINGRTGAVANMKELGILDSSLVRLQVLKVAFEVTILLLKIDDVVSGTKKQVDPDANVAPSSKGPAIPHTA
ncbi:T-complex protein 1 subunit gamma-like [Pempheris klunzingeri]|uniref:T-complex protein 1 subunit gamma-like n=1 Tax=Pempheris klunzingeri TaxID=3127111 RepID=UPI00397F3899